MKSYEGKDKSILPGRANKRNLIMHTVLTSLDKSYSTSLKEDENNKYSGPEMVVFHNWLWESCLVYLTVLSFLELNKEHLEPVYDFICSSAFFHMITCILG